MPLSEHVRCVAIAFKITEPVQQRICIKFCTKREHFSAENTDKSGGCSYGQLLIWQLHQDNAPAHASLPMQRFLAKHQITHVTQPPTAQIWLPETSGFPKAKITFEREDISDH